MDMERVQGLAHACVAADCCGYHVYACVGRIPAAYTIRDQMGFRCCNGISCFLGGSVYALLSALHCNHIRNKAADRKDQRQKEYANR